MSTCCPLWRPDPLLLRSAAHSPHLGQIGHSSAFSSWRGLVLPITGGVATATTSHRHAAPIPSGAFMIRRTILSAAAAIALVAMPMAAMAYDAPGYNTTVSDPTPDIGQAITVTTTGAAAGETLTLTITSNPATISNDAITIAGTKALAKVANASGTVTCTVTLTAAGTYTLAVTNAAGALVGDEVVTVAAAAAATPALSSTGFDAIGLAGGGTRC